MTGAGGAKRIEVSAPTKPERVMDSRNTSCTLLPYARGSYSAESREKTRQSFNDVIAIKFAVVRLAV